jgi:hypothetical protein
MAITKYHAITKTLNKAINYINDPMKTDYQSLISGYNCEPTYADLDFQMTRDLAKEIKGDYSKVGGNNNLAYHMIQSFDPEDNLTPEKAHEIGKKLAGKFLDNKYEYIVSTHVDKDHIHNHIIFNATSFYDYNKFQSKLHDIDRMRNISDDLCLENNLNVILENKNVGKKRGEIEHIKRGTSWKEKLRNTIDYIMENEKPKSYKKFTKLLNDHDIEVKEGKYISFKFKNEQKRYSRGKTLGAEYTKERLKGRMSEKTINITINKRLIEKHSNDRYYTKIPGLKKYISFDENNVQRTHKNKSIKVFIDPDKNYLIKDSTNKVIESVLGAKIHKYYDDPKSYKVTKNKSQIDFSSFGDYVEYVNKEKSIASVHEMADLLNIIYAESITKLPDFEDRIDDLRKESYSVKETIKALDQKSIRYKNVAKYLNTYNQYKDIKMKYEKQLPFFKKKYYQKHESELKLFNRAEEKLAASGVNTNVDPNKIITLVEKQRNDIDKIKDDFDKLNKRLDKVRKGHALANKILEIDDISKEKKLEQKKNKDLHR